MSLANVDRLTWSQSFYPSLTMKMKAMDSAIPHSCQVWSSSTRSSTRQAQLSQLVFGEASVPARIALRSSAR
jgi:hypothetical protein